MYTTIVLDKARNMRLGMKAISLVEKKLKKPIAKLDMDNLTMEDMATIIWAGLFHEDKSLNVDKVMDLIDEHSNIRDVMTAVGEAISQAFGDSEESGESPEKN